jgi:hypothetical protein
VRRCLQGYCSGNLLDPGIQLLVLRPREPELMGCECGYISAGSLLMFSMETRLRATGAFQLRIMASSVSLAVRRL